MVMSREEKEKAEIAERERDAGIVSSLSLCFCENGIANVLAKCALPSWH